MSTKERSKQKWAPPAGWEITSRGDVQEKDHMIEGIVGVRRYPNGIEREVLAHSEDEFDRLAGLQDDHARRSALAHRGELADERRRLEGRLSDVNEQIKAHDWATD